MKQYFETPTQILFKQDAETMRENGSRALLITMKSSAVVAVVSWRLARLN